MRLDSSLVLNFGAMVSLSISLYPTETVWSASICGEFAAVSAGVSVSPDASNGALGTSSAVFCDSGSGCVWGRSGRRDASSWMEGAEMSAFGTATHSSVGEVCKV